MIKFILIVLSIEANGIPAYKVDHTLLQQYDTYADCRAAGVNLTAGVAMKDWVCKEMAVPQTKSDATH